jgi:hypothetical protein
LRLHSSWRLHLKLAPTRCIGASWRLREF